jgi:hypothetical protein
MIKFNQYACIYSAKSTYDDISKAQTYAMYANANLIDWLRLNFAYSS